MSDAERHPDLQQARRALWEDLAARARGLSCPVHFVGPWRVVVSGDSPQSMRLQVYGCCERIGQAVSEMVRADPRVASPS